MSDYQVLTQIDNKLTKSKILELKKGKNYFYVYEENGYIKGYMVYVLNVEDVQIIKLFVDPIYRRSGIATEMLVFLLKKLNANRPSMKTWTWDDNLVAHLFLKSMGFVGSVNPDNPDQYDFIFTPKELSNA